MNMKHTVLVYKKVETEEEAEILRNIRNQCREYMTRNTGFISKEQQATWFQTAGDKYDLYIVYALEFGAAVVFAGYGVIHKNIDASLLTGGLLPDYRNQGLGQSVFQFLIETSMKRHLPIRLEVLKTNLRAIKVYEKLNFTTYQETDKVLMMEYHYDSVI